MRIEAWMTAVAAAAFAAGTAVGLVAPLVLETGEPDPDDAVERQVRRYRDDFGLDHRQQRLLRAILHERDRRRRSIVFAAPRLWPKELRTQIEQADREADRLIWALLDDEQRSKYRRLRADNDKGR